MVIQKLLFYLANNQQLIQKLADSYPMRRAAQISLYYFYRGQHLANKHELTRNISPEKFKSILGAFKQNLKQEIESAKKEIKRK